MKNFDGTQRSNGAALQVLFDLDGTLTDPKVGITKSIAYALDSFGIAVDRLESLEHLIGPPLRDSFRAHYGFGPAQVEQAIAKYREYFAETGIFENHLYDGIVDLLEQLKAAGVLMAIATSKPTVFAEKIAVHFGIAPYFQFIAGSELNGTRERKAEVIAHALRNVDPQRKLPAVMIGDRKHDIIGAQEMGIESIGVTWGFGSRAELANAGADAIVDTMDALYGKVMEVCL